MYYPVFVCVIKKEEKKRKTLMNRSIPFISLVHQPTWFKANLYEVAH